MSFNNYQSTSNNDGNQQEQDFAKVAQNIANNIQKIINNVNQLQQMVNQLGTPQDSENLRSQLHKIQHYTKQLTQDTNKNLQQLFYIPSTGNLTTSEQKQRRIQRERLMNDFSETLKNFQIIQRTTAQKEKESIIRARANSHVNDVGVGGGNNRQALIDLQSPQSYKAPPIQTSQQQIRMEENVDIELLEEREQAIRKIESDIVAVNQIFKNLATTVHNQGEIIDSIEANIESTNIQIQEGNEQLAKASDYSMRARKKKIILIAILLIIVAIIGLIIYISN